MDEIEQLKKRIEELEKNAQRINFQQYPSCNPCLNHPNLPPHHCHGRQPCYNNPCVWC